MKKTLYMAAVLATLAGCAKTESQPENPVGSNLELTANVEGIGTKAVFDGDSHIKFEKGDAFRAAIALPSAPDKAVKVASQNLGVASGYDTAFKLEDPNADTPVFKGNFYSIVEAQNSDTYKFYGVFPSDAVASSGENLTAWRVQVKGEQTSSQTSWQNKADVMLVEPADVTVEGKEKTQYNEYNSKASLNIKFAHLFGFGKICFADIPDTYAGLNVDQVVVEAVGENKDLVGIYKIDITKEVDEIQPVPFNTGSKVTVTPEAAVTVADNVVWFVANPGTYDVKVTVKTSRYDLVFERAGLNIKRGKIAAPTVHFKAADVAVSHDVALAEGETWSHTPTYNNSLISTRKKATWGDGEKKMAFSLAYPKDANGTNAGTTYYKSNNAVSQGFAQSRVIGDKVVLSSGASFSGVKMLKLNLGIYTASASCDFTVALANGTDTTVIKKISVATGEETPNADGADYFIENTTGVEAGDLVITLDNLSKDDIRPYLGLLVLNPKPELVVGESELKFEKDGGTGEVACNAYATKSEPKVSSDAEWLKVTYADGKISYTAEANADSKRTATVTVTLTDGDFTVTKTISAKQKSATSLEYKLTVTPAVMNEILKVEAEKHPDADATSYYPIDAKFTAVATDGSGKTVDVNMHATWMYVTDLSDASFRMRGKFYCSSSIGFVEKVVITANSPVSMGNYAALSVKFSKDGTTWNNLSSSALTVDGKTSTLVNEDEDNTSFSIDATGGFSILYVDSFEVTFIGE